MCVKLSATPKVWKLRSGIEKPILAVGVRSYTFDN